MADVQVGEEMTKWTTKQIKNQFLIISQPRAGTQMLERALSSHPDVVMRAWSTSQDNHHPVMDLYGFRQMTPDERRRPFRGTVTHSWGDEFTRRTFGLPLDRYWKVVSCFFPRVVVLTRVNQLRRYLSYKVAEHLGQWGVHEPRTEDPVIEFDFDDFLGFMRDTLAYWSAVVRAFPTAMYLTYEGLTVNWDAAMMYLLDFLGIRQVILKPTTHQQEFRRVRDIIGNWDHNLESRFTYYGWERWLGEMVL